MTGLTKAQVHDMFNYSMRLFEIKKADKKPQDYLSHQSLQSYKEVGSYPLYESSINTFDISPTDLILTGGEDGKGILVDQSAGKIVSTINSDLGSITGC